MSHEINEYLIMYFISFLKAQVSTTKVSLAKSSVMRSSVVALLYSMCLVNHQTAQGQLSEKRAIMLPTASHCVQDAKLHYCRYKKRG